MRRVELNPMTLTEMGSGGGRRGVQATQEARRRNKEDGALITILSNLIFNYPYLIKLFYPISSNYSIKSYQPVFQIPSNISWPVQDCHCLT